MRYQLVEAKERVGSMHGFLVPGDRAQAADEIRRLLEEWPGVIVEHGGQRILASTLDPVSVMISHETEPRGTVPVSGRPRYAIDGTFVDGLQQGA